MDILYGVVVNNNDPSRTGKVKIKICGEHDETSDIETLPWAEVMQSASNGLIGGIGFSNVLKNGTWVYAVKLGNLDNRYLVIGTCTGIVGEETIKGFEDPNKQYPLSQTKGLSDFGHCSITDESLNNKALNDTTTTSNGTSFKYENTVTSDKYTEMSVFRTASGMMVELDDSESRMKITHPSGTTVTLNPDGTVNITSLKDMNVNVKGNANWNVKGDWNLNVDGKSTTKIKGDCNVCLDGEYKEVTLGNKRYQVSGNTSYVCNSSVDWTVDNSVQWDISNNINFTSDSGLIKGPNSITKKGVNLDKHVHGGVDRGRSDTNRAEESV